MAKIISILILGIIFPIISFAQPKPYGYRFSDNGDIVSDIFFIQNGYVLDSAINNISHLKYYFEYDKNGRLKRDVNFYRIVTLIYVNGRPRTKYLPGTRDYYYDESGNIDSLGYGHWNDSLWVNDSSGYKFHYNNDGKIISKIYWNKDTVSVVEQNTYDSSGNLILNTVTNYLFDICVTTTREYDSQNRMTLKKSLNSSNQTTQQNESLYIYQYDSSGNVNCRFKSISNVDTLTGGFNYYLEFDETGKVVNEIFSSQLMSDSTWGDNDYLAFSYDESNKILHMGDIVRFHYNVDGNLDSLINLHSVYCGYLGNTATLIDKYGNNIVLSGMWGNNNFYYSSMVTGIKTNAVMDTEFILYQNYPNPFNPATTITYSLPKRSLVTLKIYDILGREVTALVNEEKNSGTYNIKWNAQGMPSGVYIYKIAAGEYLKTNKMILLK